MTRRQILLVVAVVIAAIIIGACVAANTRTAFANLPPVVEPTPSPTVAPRLSTAPVVVFVPWVTR